MLVFAVNYRMHLVIQSPDMLEVVTNPEKIELKKKINNKFKAEEE